MPEAEEIGFFSAVEWSEGRKYPVQFYDYKTCDFPDSGGGRTRHLTSIDRKVNCMVIFVMKYIVRYARIHTLLID